MIKTNSVDEYIANFPEDAQKLLKELRATILKSAPKAEETISYQMPAYKLGGALVYFAAYKKHIGFYPGASGVKHFEKEISDYKNSKGAIQFPIDQPLPLKLIEKIVKFRVKENLEQKSRKK